ncbi:lytic polysaccharide monooxygenase, partial [Cadophora sp. DSE1049]
MHISRLRSASTSPQLCSPALSLLLTFLLVALNNVASHTIFTNLFIDGIDQGDATCVRMPMTPHNATFPITDLESRDMACGYDGTKGVARVCPVSASSKLTFQFREYPDYSRPGAIDSSHLGPCAVYMKHVSSAIKDNGVGDGWFKIASMGYDAASKKWCTQKLSEKNGLLDLGVKIPEDLARGYYLVRPELLSLHDADKDPPNPQFYTGCAQIFVASAGTALPKYTVKIPGYVGITDKSVLFDVYNPVWPYAEPGPEVYTPGRSPGRTVGLLQRQDEGLLPGNARIVNANWWGVELSSYGDENGLFPYQASKSCYSQADAYYKSAPPTGSKNCKVWESRCSEIQGACKQSILTGPPN